MTKRAIALMNKGDLVELVAIKADTTKKVANAVLDALIDSITKAVADGEKVTLVGFGTFNSRERKSREARNLKTGEPIKIPAGVVPVFSAGKEFKQVVSLTAATDK